MQFIFWQFGINETINLISFAFIEFFLMKCVAVVCNTRLLDLKINTKWIIEEINETMYINSFFLSRIKTKSSIVAYCLF